MPLLKLIPPQYRILAGVLLLAAVFAAGLGIGHEWRDRACDLTVTEIENRALKAQQAFDQEARVVDQLRDAVTKRNTELFEARRQAETAKARVITREVIRYVTENPDAGRCDLPAEWLRIHDASAGTDLPPAAGAAGAPDDATARAFTDADALRVITENYQTCLSEFTRLRQLQEWYRGQQAIKSEKEK